MSFADEDILADLGCKLTRKVLELPRSPWDVTELQSRIEEALPYVNLNSEDARKQVIIGPILIELAKKVKAPLRIQYPVKVNQYLKGSLDYYFSHGQNLLVVEAKNDDMARGFVQLAAELIALNLWIAKRQNLETLDTPLIGAVTIGDLWQFARYDPAIAVITQDVNTYSVPKELADVAAILKGILTS
jgi:hypothetical protein